MREALDIRVKGVVQGVGFRPFVYRLAKRFLISGWVLNGVDGVFIHAEGESKLLDEFVIELSECAPQASRVEEIDLKEVPLKISIPSKFVFLTRPQRIKPRWSLPT